MMTERKPETKQLGLYIHVPFCVRKCEYCDFLSFPAGPDPSSGLPELYGHALENEITGYGRRFAAEEALKAYQVSTVYFGGGTPSVLDGRQIESWMELLSEQFPFPKTSALREQMEITIEANPGTLSKDKLTAYRRAGINRLSIGLQSADNRELSVLGRIHTFEQFVENFKLARSCGFQNISVDLMSGLPGQSVLNFRETLNKAAALKPEHLSVYGLIIEEGTPFYERYGGPEAHAGAALALPDEEEDRIMYRMTNEILEEAGYYRYEISNYARPGFESRHNKAYWERKPYIGLGLGAASFFEGLRFCNYSDFKSYLKNQETKSKTERLSKKEAMEETMFLGLRMSRGVSKALFAAEFGRTMEEVYGAVLKKHMELGVLIEDGDYVRLTEYGIDVSNMVLAEYLLD